MTEREIFIEEVRNRVPVFERIVNIFNSSTQAAGLMLLAAIVALVIANSPAHEGFLAFFHTDVGFFFGDMYAEMSLAHVINDIFMAIFFLLIGLEIKSEMTVGELTNIRQAILPIGAAFGGVAVPIVIYLLFNAGNPETSHGWGIPTATDIAFALGIMALLGNRVPNGIKVFLSTLAVADDIIAILVIAIFYGQTPSFVWLGAAAAVLLILIILNRSKVYSLYPYLLLGVVLWYCVFMSGVHSTIAGVLLAFVIPAGSHINLRSFTRWSGEKVKEYADYYEPDVPILGQPKTMRSAQQLSRMAKQVVPPAVRLEKRLYPWVYFAILPLFALTNADVSFVGAGLDTILAAPEFWGVALGLLIGKPIGIVLMSLLIVKLKVATLPNHVNWGHMVGAGILGGVGFTMAIFVANLAFVDPTHVTTAKVGILTASFLAGVIGFLVLYLQARKAKTRGVVYMSDEENQHDDDLLVDSELEALMVDGKVIDSISLDRTNKDAEESGREDVDANSTKGKGPGKDDT